MAALSRIKIHLPTCHVCSSWQRMRTGRHSQQRPQLCSSPRWRNALVRGLVSPQHLSSTQAAGILQVLSQNGPVSGCGVLKCSLHRRVPRREKAKLDLCTWQELLALRLASRLHLHFLPDPSFSHILQLRFRHLPLSCYPVKKNVPVH